ncbi:hypothetical protein JTB14_021996 [Gonioctena quinquepunctata]|nr:hypothetical protein JTB14_021996 [Gonioctena quinquepunctata]
MIRNRLIRMAKVINNIGQLDANSGNFKKPYLPPEIGTALKYIISLYKSECIKSKDNVGKSNAEDLSQLLNTALPAHINKTATERLLNQKRSKEIKLPSTEDIRRPGELERALLTDLDTLVSMNKDTLLNHNLNDAEQKRAEVYSRFVVRRKLARGVPVLLHDSYKTYLDLVLSHRKEAAVHPENPFVFAAPQGNTKNVIYEHLWATTLMPRNWSSFKDTLAMPTKFTENITENPSPKGHYKYGKSFVGSPIPRPLRIREAESSRKHRWPQLCSLLDHLACARTPATQEVVWSATPPVKANPGTMAQLQLIINQRDGDC